MGTLINPMPQELDQGRAAIAVSDNTTRQILGMKLGAMMHDDRGRIFRLAKAGASNLTAFKQTISPAIVANHTAMTWVSGGAKGAQEVVATLGATATTARQYTNGTLVVESGTGAGQVFDVDFVAVTAASGNARIRLASNQKFTTTLDATSKLTLVANRFDGTLIAAADATQVPTGIPLIAVTAAYVYASLTGGDGPALAGGAIAKGERLTFDNGGGAVAGALLPSAADTDTILAIGGEDSIADTEYGLVYYQIDK